MKSPRDVKSTSLDQLQNFHDSWIGLARLYQLRSQTDTLVPGLSVSQFYALEELSRREDSMTMSDFAKALGLSLAGVNRMIEGLERSGFAIKAACKEDGRAQRVRITPKGGSVYSRVDQAFMTHVRSVFSRLEEREQGALVRALPIMIEAVQSWRKALAEPSNGRGTANPRSEARP